MRTAALGAALALLAAPAAAGTAEAEPPQIDARVALVGDGESWREPSDEPPHPGETLAVALSWPDGARPDRPRLAAAAAGGETPSFRAVGLVPRHPAAGGEDVLLLLPLALGELTIPPLEILDGGGRPAARTRELTVEIAPALDEADAEPAPERRPAAVTLEPVGLAIAAGVLALSAALAVWLLRRVPRRQLDEPEPPPPPAVPAHVTALSELDELLRSGLLERGEIKPFCVRLAEIGKTYVSARAGVSLLERTTEECERLLARQADVGDEAAWLFAWLRALDLVKFADDRPGAPRLTALAEKLRASVHELEARRAGGDEHERRPPAGPPAPRTGAPAKRAWPETGGAR